MRRNSPGRENSVWAKALRSTASYILTSLGFSTPETNMGKNGAWRAWSHQKRYWQVESCSIVSSLHTLRGDWEREWEWVGYRLHVRVGRDLLHFSWNSYFPMPSGPSGPQSFSKGIPLVQLEGFAEMGIMSSRGRVFAMKLWSTPRGPGLLDHQRWLPSYWEAVWYSREGLGLCHLCRGWTSASVTEWAVQLFSCLKNGVNNNTCHLVEKIK